MKGRGYGEDAPDATRLRGAGRVYGLLFLSGACALVYPGLEEYTAAAN